MEKTSRHHKGTRIVKAAALAAVLTACSTTPEPPAAPDAAPPTTPTAADNLNTQSRVVGPIAGTPFESVCHLQIRRAPRLFGLVLPLIRRSYTGSAVLYDGRYLLTAGHNAYQDNSSIREIKVRCGVADALSIDPQQIVASDQGLDAAGYTGSPFSRDFAVIRLNEPVAVAKPFRLARQAVKVGEDIRLAGYPGGPHNGWTLHAGRGRVTRIADGTAYYDILTHKSNSGGPVWRDTAAGPELVAIHTTGNDRAMAWFGGRIVNEDYRAEITRLIAELDRRAAVR